ncbi:zinc finger protein 2-like isoform X3 [Scleropages formosus]|uniref:zinc finger protein 2-like isoform X3 n=1 Tax=Scleropages formosus TaxID=113540 RepID=UPI0010FAC12A|nr:zinc finger protein 2-like isoform X3 [Scleropages formosus]
MSAEAILTFQSQLSGIMETVLRAAVHEITSLVEDSFKGEVVRSRKEVETLRRRLQWSERRWRERDAGPRCAECGRVGVSPGEQERVPTGTRNEEEDRGDKENSALDRDWCEGSWTTPDAESAAPLSPIINPEQNTDLEWDRSDLLHKEETLKEPLDTRCSSLDVAEASNILCHSNSLTESEPQNFEKELRERDAEDLRGKALKAEPKDVHITPDAKLNKLDLGDSLVRINQIRKKRQSSHVKAEYGPFNSNIHTSDKSVKAVSMDMNKIADPNQCGPCSGLSHSDMDVRVFIKEKEHLKSPDRHDVRPSATQLENKDRQPKHKSHDCEFWVSSQKCTEDCLSSSFMKNCYSCPYCRHTYSNLVNLNIHLQSHSAERLHSSSQLPMACKQWDGKHDSTYSCYYGKKCNSTGTLERHQKVHKGEVLHRCGQCGKTFNRAYNLKIHQRSHTGERPYLCTHCKKGFISPTDLRRHKRIHTGEKPYACMLCGSKFSQSWSLKIHQRIHTQEKPHCCMQCGKCFRCSGDLSKHMRVHTGEKPYICELCGKRYSQSQNLKSHRCFTQLQAGNCQGGC